MKETNDAAMAEKELKNQSISLAPEKNKQRTSNRKFIIFSIVLFLIILVVGSIAFIFAMQQIVRTNKGAELSKMLEVKRITLETSVNAEIAITLKLADSPLMKRYFISPNDHELEELALAEIASYRSAFSGFSIFWVNDVDKIFYSDDNQAYLLDPEDPGNYWYNMTLHNTKVYNVNINYNPDIQAVKLWINAPVFDDDGKPLGMVGTGIELSVFVDIIRDSIKDNTELYFFNTNGEITGAKDIGSIVEKRNIEVEVGRLDIGIYGILNEARKLKAGETKVFDVRNGKAAIGTVPTLGWYSITFMPDSIDDYKTPMTALFFVMLMIIALIIVLFNLFIYKTLKSLNKTMESLEIASSAKSDFLAKMSHEIRTPMNAIIGMSDLVLRENVPPIVSEQVLTIKQSGANLLSIINDILDFSKIEKGQLEIIQEEYQVASLINDVINIIKMRILDSSLRFIVNIDCNMPSILYGAVVRIRQIMLNILNNAVKYTERGFVSLFINCETIDGDSRVTKLKIEVVDSGRGIKKENFNNLFEEFVQFDRDYYRGIEGTGLGLAITNSLVKKMGGEIHCTSEYGKGSIFTVTIPQEIRSLEKIAHVEKAEEKRVLIYERREVCINSITLTMDNLGVAYKNVSSVFEFYDELASKKYSFAFVATILYEYVKEIYSELQVDTKIVLIAEFGDVIKDQNLSLLITPIFAIPVANILNGVHDNYTSQVKQNAINSFIAPEARILVVDDINTNLRVAEGLMRPYKMRLDLYTSAMEAIEAVKSNRYDLIFMDYMMPNMNGVEATKRIRALGAEDPYYSNIPIIALTATAVSGAKEMLMENGFNDFLSKPIDTVKLSTILTEWVPKEKQKKILPYMSKDDLGCAGCTSNQKIEIQGIDIKKGIATSGGSLENYKKTLAIFLRDGHEKTDEIKKCLETANLSLYVTYVHALKSAAANIGAFALSEMAQVLEAAGKKDDLKFIQEHSAKLLSTLKMLLSNINKVINTDKQDDRKNCMDMGLLKAELAKLAEAIDSVNPSVIRVAVKNIQPFVKAAVIGGDVENILQKTLIGEYDEAILMINTLLEKKG